MILITEFMEDTAVEFLRSGFEVNYAPDLVNKQANIPERIAQANALIVRNQTQVNNEVLDAASHLLCVGRLGVGLDNIDMDACEKKGVTVYPALGANNLSVVEYVIASSMTLLRGAYRQNDKIMAGEWPRHDSCGYELAGKKLGLIGFGSIARDTAIAAQALGVRVCAYDPFLPENDSRWGNVERVSLDGLLECADIVSLHIPMTKDTYHLMDAWQFKKMKPGSILINAARGGILDEGAMIDAMRSGILAGAALDVFENEPLDAIEGQKFEGLNNLILTPHIAGVTKESNERVSTMTADLISKHLNGEMQV